MLNNVYKGERLWCINRKIGANGFVILNEAKNLAAKRELSAEDIVHYGKVVAALGETIRLMAEVNGVIESAGGWPVK